MMHRTLTFGYAPRLTISVAPNRLTVDVTKHNEYGRWSVVWHNDSTTNLRYHCRVLVLRHNVIQMAARHKMLPASLRS
jgi:hypothetical protein